MGNTQVVSCKRGQQSVYMLCKAFARGIVCLKVCFQTLLARKVGQHYSSLDQELECVHIISTLSMQHMLCRLSNSGQLRQPI